MLGELVSQLYPYAFNGILLASYGAYNGTALPITNTGDITVPGNTTAGCGVVYAQYRVTAIIVRSPLISGASGNVSAGALGVWTGAGQTGTNLVANASLTNLTSSLTWQAMTLTSAANSTILTGPAAIYFNVGTGVANGTIEADIFGVPITGRG